MDFEKLMRNLRARGIDASLFDTKEEAVAYLKGELEGRKIVFGGSMTLKEMGLFEALSEDNSVFWHWQNSPGNRYQVEREASVYITSANAVSMSGELVNIDGNCNRVANAIYGNDRVYYVFGQNKIEDSLESAIDRARNIAAPLNAKRLSRATPCVEGGKCFDCSVEERICGVMTIVMRKTGGMEHCEAIIVKEDLGY